MSEELPLVTVNILSYNRKDELRHTLTKVYEQDYKNIEVIVVDNASSDGSPEMVEMEFPEVILIKLDKNIGIAGWNKGFEIAKGEYILVLDDDAYPERESLFHSTLKMKDNDLIGAIAFNIYDINTDKMFWAGTWLPDFNIEETTWPVFVGCAVLIKNKVFTKIQKHEFFPTNVYLYQHELAVSASLNNFGQIIYYDKKITARHNCKVQSQYCPRVDKLIFRNNLLFIIEFLPRLIMPLYLAQIIIFFSIRSSRRNWFFDFLMILRDSISKKEVLSKNRVNYKYFFSLRKLHLFNFSLLSKIKNLVT